MGYPTTAAAGSFANVKAAKLLTLAPGMTEMGRHEGSVSRTPNGCYWVGGRKFNLRFRAAVPGQEGPTGVEAPRSTRAMMPFWAATATV